MFKDLLGNSKASILRRLFVEGLLALLIGIGLIIYYFLGNQEVVILVVGITSVVAGLVFLIGQYVMGNKKYEKYRKEQNNYYKYRKNKK